MHADKACARLALNKVLHGPAKKFNDLANVRGKSTHA